MACKRKQLAALIGVIACLVWPALGDDWPTYRHDVERSGISSERMSAPLSEDWVFTPANPPAHAWGDPQPKRIESALELPRLRFDDAFHAVSDGKMVYFGSSADNNVYALDAKTGEVRWEFVTGGPVRLAPTLWKGKLYVGSDDGKAYCLSTKDGREIWSMAAAPDEMVLGNGKMISRWPVRTGVIVDRGVAYFGAGVFPADGQYLYAVDAKSGKVLWKNDIYAFGGRGAVTPQGYLLASKNMLFMPSGRTKPAAFSREDGQFLYQKKLNWRQDGLFGGTYCALAGDILFNGTEQMIGLYTINGRLAFTENARRWVVDKNVVYLLTGEEVLAYDRKEWTAANKAMPRLNGQIMMLTGRREQLKEIAATYKKAVAQLPDVEKQLAEAISRREEGKAKAKWRAACKATDSLALTRGMLFAGGENAVFGFDTKTGRQVWSGKVNGRARGLAVANGRLIVSTDKGSIHCFVKGGKGKGLKVAQAAAYAEYVDSRTGAITGNPFSRDELSDFYVGRAQQILRDSGVKRGYALILGGEGRLAFELAKGSELTIYVVQPNAEKVTAAREALSKVGLLGTKVVVKRGSLNSLPFSDYFANLIVCESQLHTTRIAAPAAEILRVLKPCGGVAYVGQSPGPGVARPGAEPSIKPWVEGLRTTLSGLGETSTSIKVTGNRAKVIRGPLPGAGKWTHQYGNAGNTASGDDEYVRGPIGILWYGEPGPERMPNRHRSAAAPLALNGRMFIQGENVIMTYDAYNGVKLWEREIPGAMRLNLKTAASNLAADDESIFVAIGTECLRLDQATGRTLKRYRVPPSNSKHRNWQYLACAGNTLVGCRARDRIFAVDIGTGRLKWSRKVKDVSLTSICLGDGRVFFVDRSATEAQKAQALKGVPAEARIDRKGEPIQPDVRLVVALDLQSGQVSWAKPQYVSDCLAQIVRKGNVQEMGDVTAMYAKGVLLLCGQPWNGHFWKEFFRGEFSRRSLIALSGKDGSDLWSGRIGYRSRPLIVGETIIAEPWAHDLRTGKPKLRTHPITAARAKWQIARPGHHCGNIAGAPNVLLFRSGTSAYYDLIGDYGTAHFGAQRPGCWINSIPANGLVMMPEASSGCVCPYSLHCTIVFAPQKTNRTWGMFSAPGPLTPVKHLAVNFGAPGDRKDSAGTLWLGFPRPRRDRLVADLRVGVRMHKDGKYYRKNDSFLAIEGTEDAWINACGISNVARCAIPVARDSETTRRYTIRLHFTDTENDRRGQRVFDIALQGQTVVKNFDIIAAGGGPNKAVVAAFKNIPATDTVVVTLEPKKGKTLLCGVEVIAEE